MTRERAEAIDRHLERLKDSCLRIHSDNVSYQICELLQEIVSALPKENSYIAKETNELFDVCGDCKNFGWDMPQCQYCNSTNGFKYFERKYNDNE